jgi:hypothetical protein
LIVRSPWRAAWRSKALRPSTCSWKSRTQIPTDHSDSVSATSISRSRSSRSSCVGGAGVTTAGTIGSRSI